MGYALSFSALTRCLSSLVMSASTQAGSSFFGGGGRASLQR